MSDSAVYGVKAAELLLALVPTHHHPNAEPGSTQQRVGPFATTADPAEDTFAKSV